MIGTIRKRGQEWVVEYQTIFFTQPSHAKGVFGVTHRKYSTKELPLHSDSLDDGKGYKREFFDGEPVNFEIVKDHGLDPYDNQIPGIDYKDVAKISYPSSPHAGISKKGTGPGVRFSTKKPTAFEVAVHQSTHPDCGIHPTFQEKYVRVIKQPQKRWDDIRELLNTGRFPDRDLDFIIDTLKAHYDPPRPKE